ncbi:flagellar hook-basal body complex protein FliE [Frigoribacterium endophyticum]|jgi:flagellar hook-basal body complex protein FliE|uniref:flagellar hook-basal body complex protein FliE n=1 Tax=Frigoribacterium endophyticum TaxID=1522176 RepID=UPI0014237C71|nr:flagellar hook-basal body complex protein FliE [Frigoribacterium endophyticum]NII51930.1 flagellar hook-basal body complex protein FliE [Frigoribacterium endophyticum]
MPVAGIPALGAVQPSGYADVSSLMQAGGAGGAGGVADVTGVAGAPTASGATFGASMVGAVEGLQQLQGEAKTLAVKAVTGDLTDIHDATIAATRAQVTLELVSAVRNKAVDAFTEIMRMQA